jgi:uncharacterized protein YdeI (YjbR/CyaY-like superfamily)
VDERPETTFFASPAAFRAWLEEHHETESEVWVGYYRKATGKPSMTWSEAVDEALCFGWIDGKRQRVDEERHRQRFTPRRRESNWSAINIAKVAELRAAGRMTPAGEAAFAVRREDRSAVYSYERRHDAAFDREQEATFRRNEAAWAWFGGQAPSYRRTATFWVVSAKRPETQAKRLATLVECSAEGRRVPPLVR